MKYSYLIINLKNNFELKFKLLDTPVTELWIERMSQRANSYLDHPDRFYGFSSPEQEQHRALTEIQTCITNINSYQPIIDRTLLNIDDQDTLNYLHHIFEKYHGLLDQQNHEFWIEAPDLVKKSLAELNIAVHRCESVYRSNHPRFVCTWFGLPKIKTMPPEYFYKYGHLCPPFGTVCINYVEIGKTLEDLVRDNDKYISDDAFKPFNYYSADFVVRFFEENLEEIRQRLTEMKRYYLIHQDFFRQHNILDFNDPRLLPFRLPVAQLIETVPRDQLLHQIQQRQSIIDINLE